MGIVSRGVLGVYCIVLKGGANMFICGKCKKQTGSKEKMTKVVIESRVKHYPCGSIGSEIVREIGVCSKCAKGA